MSYGVGIDGSMSPLPGANCGSSFSVSPHGSASLSPTLQPPLPPLQRGDGGAGGGGVALGVGGGPMPMRRSSGPAAHGNVPPPLVLSGGAGQGGSPMGPGSCSPTSVTNPLSPQVGLNNYHNIYSIFARRNATPSILASTACFNSFVKLYDGITQ